ncbi:MAG: exo-beta-N-acetylmuramidase NamZ domain-containing protein [Phycisphaeraceae bacterium]
MPTPLRSIIALALLAATPALAQLQVPEADKLIEAAIAKGDIPGAVLLVGHKGQTVYRKAYGHRALEPAKEAMTVDTLFDMASLTKPIATATSVCLLLDQGKIKLSDPVAKHLPEFGANGKEKITIEQLLTHRGGLIADNHLRDYTDGKQQAWKNICALKTIYTPGTKVTYTDVGFIVLGELVERISGKRLSHFAKENVFEPLGMKDTMYLPPSSLYPRCAPTEKRDGAWMKGQVHDPRAYWLEGVAGHAGLFSTADDVAKYAWMLLRGGEANKDFGGKRIFSQAMVTDMIRPRYLTDGTGGRGLGWDVDTAYSSPRGHRYPRGTSYGHTGFTGTSLWIDPASDSFVILLTNRVHPNGKGNTVALRREVATAVCDVMLAGAKTNSVLTGIDVLVRDRFKQLDGRKVALITNHTGRDAKGNRTVDLLHEAKNVNLVKLFAPEHGLYGVLDTKVGHGVDEKTKLPVFSLYGDTRRPSKEMLEGVDTIVFDIQDIGTRFYTYISTLGNAMEEAAKLGIRVVVLDRPNPISPLGIDGPISDSDRSSFVCYRPLPLVHGMTVGELAMLFNKEDKINCDLQVVKCEGWKRSMWFDDTGLTWVNPSPNMRNLTQATVYAAVGLVEYSNISVGRGTDQPFEFLGAPWIDGPALAAAMNELKLPGVRFVPIEFTPESSKYKGEACKGVYILLTDRAKLQPARTGLSLARKLLDVHGPSFEALPMLKLLCSFKTYEAVMGTRDPATLPATWADELATFERVRAKYLMYE